MAGYHAGQATRGPVDRIGNCSTGGVCIVQFGSLRSRGIRWSSANTLLQA